MDVPAFNNSGNVPPRFLFLRTIQYNPKFVTVPTDIIFEYRGVGRVVLKRV
jgi:hypothetical protein